jgi:cell wall-associated NlpC family hydrolase
MKLNLNLQLRQITLSLAIFNSLGFVTLSSSNVFATPPLPEANTTQPTLSSSINSNALANTLNAVTAVANANAGLSNGNNSTSTTNSNLITSSAIPSNNGAINFVTNFTNQLDKASQAVTDTASGLVTTAFGFLGVPYKFGGTNTETGIDCSALVMLIYKESLGMVLPRTAAEQAKASQSIDQKDLKPGDLVFYNTMKRTFSHVGIYIGDGKFIHAPRTGALVRVEEMDQTYWKKRFDGARRVIAQTPSIQAR